MFLRRLLLHILPFFIIGGLFFGGLFFLWIGTLRIPDLSSFEERRVTQSTKIYDRTGDVLLFDLHENVQRTVVPAGEMSRHIKNATVAIEDAEFYEHGGIKFSAIARAALSNLLVFLRLESGYTQGGSTITQQVVKNSILTKDKTLTRKIKEWVLAFKIERVLSKEEILELYLNESPYGGNLYGVEEAARALFGVSAAALSLPQAAYLAALPQAPTYYSPYGPHKDALEARKNLVLLKMKENGFIAEEDYENAKSAVVEFLPPRDRGIKAPHFVFFVRDYLAQKYGEEALLERGFRVISTLDWELQKEGEKIVEEYARENEKKFNASNAGLLALDPKTGQILTMVGSRGYFDTDIPGSYNVTLAKRQPGSAIKPFVYAAAFEKGYTPETVLFDVPTQFSTACAADNFTSEGDCYSPGNYDNIFRGPVTMRNALAQSINVPSVKTLYLAGLKGSIRLAKDMGLTTLTDPSRYGLTLVLGGGEVRLLDIVSGYASFATEGVRREPVGVLRVEDSAGNVIEQYEDSGGVRVLSEETARTISDVLSDNAARAPAFGDASALYFPGRQVAAKTGTTNDYRDAWIIGYTPSFAAGAWAGNNDNSPMQKKVAGFIVAPLWHAFMAKALARMEEEQFTPPLPIPSDVPPLLRGEWRGEDTYVIDERAGNPATQEMPQEARQTVGGGEVHSILYSIDKNDPRSTRPVEDPSKDPQFSLWEPPVRAWAVSNGYGGARTSSPLPVQ